MRELVAILQVLLSLLLMGAILLQAKGVGLGRTFGGGGEFYRSKRGVEKILFRLTILLTFLFLLSSLISAII